MAKIEKKVVEKAPEAVGAATEPLKHVHEWRTSYGPDQAPYQVCNCGAKAAVA